MKSEKVESKREMGKCEDKRQEKIEVDKRQK